MQHQAIKHAPDDLIPLSIHVEMDNAKREAFFADVVRLFNGHEKFSIIKYAYLLLEKWSAVAQAHTDPDIALLKHLKQTGVIPPSSEMVHLGTGDEIAWEAKAAEVFKACGASLCIGADFSGEALRRFENVFERNFNDVAHKKVELDFFNTFTIPARLNNPLFLCDGITMGNAPAITSNESLDDSMVRTFRNVLNAMQHRGHFLFTLRTDERPHVNGQAAIYGEEHVSLYRNAANVDFTLSIIDLMRLSLGMEGLERGEANYMPTWDKQGAVNHSFIVSNSSGSGEREITVSNRHDRNRTQRNTSIMIEEGKAYYTNRSIIRPTEATVRNLEDAGFHNIRHFRIDDGRSRVAFLASANP